MDRNHSDEISQGKRFSFGSNWETFLSSLNDDRIHEAEESLKTMLGMTTLSGKTFLDIGSGSGLFSLAAKNLGATVHSFDYDPRSVLCTRELKRIYYSHDKNWSIDEASALDKEYLISLGRFDIVYSWGVLHHTGNMMQALRNSIIPVSQGGLIFIAIYNDQGRTSRSWNGIKRAYCLNSAARLLIKGTFIPVFALHGVIVSLLERKSPWSYFSKYKQKRGMSVYRDWIDWLGGYPFEVAKPEVILDLYRSYGFNLENLTTTNRFGCNQYVFRKIGRITSKLSTIQQNT